MRAFYLEYGVAMRSGAGAFKLDLPKVPADETNDLTPAMRQLVRSLWDQLQQLEARIQAVAREIEAIAYRSDVAPRLATVLGIGTLSATAILAAVGDGRQSCASDVAAAADRIIADHSTLSNIPIDSAWTMRAECARLRPNE